MAEFFTVITDAGREAVAKATQAGEKVNITHMAVGDGGGSAVTPDESQTQLVNECWRGLVATYKQEDTSLIIDTYIPADEESFTVREMGVFTADGVLFAVCNTPEMRKVLPSEGAVGNFTLGMELDITNIDMKYIEIHTNPELNFIPNSEKGQPNGVATLDEHGNVKELPELNFDPAGSAATVQGNLNAHINNKQNPHGVTAALIDAYTKGEINNLISSINSSIGNKATIISGSYIGNGNFGEQNPNSLHFGFAPKIVFFFDSYKLLSAGSGSFTVVNMHALSTDFQNAPPYTYVTQGTGFSKKNTEGNILTWYHSTNPRGQLNGASETYHYIAIG